MALEKGAQKPISEHRGIRSKTNNKTKTQHKHEYVNYHADQISPDAIITPGAESLLTIFPEA